MRQNKFRGWDKINKRFAYVTLHPTCISWCSPSWSSHTSMKDINEGSMGVAFDNIEGWEQYIGSKDKTGKEIYEGDIIDTPQRGIEKVELGQEYDFIGYYLCWEKGIVIGNISENPDLLEAKNDR